MFALSGLSRPTDTCSTREPPNSPFMPILSIPMVVLKLLFWDANDFAKAFGFDFFAQSIR